MIRRKLEEHYYLSLISPNFRRLSLSAAISQAVGENLTLTVGATAIALAIPTNFMDGTPLVRMMIEERLRSK